VRIYGKVFGGIIGWLVLRHPIGLVIGVALGHVLDAGWLNRGQPDDPLDGAYRTLGIERDATYFEIAERRIAEAMSQVSAPDVTTPRRDVTPSQEPEMGMLL
jgi:hypothetical protein